MTQVHLKLLGEALRTFREQGRPRRISQFRLASLMQWEGTAPVIEIEKGRRRPRPETLNALGEALHLPPADIAYLHGLAGYREVRRMPPVEQITRVLLAIEPEMARRLYPVYVLDYQFRHWMVNAATAALMGGSLERLTELMRRGVDGLQATFDSRLGDQQLTLVVHMVELLHLDRLLFVGYYEPKEDGANNRARCEAYFSQYRSDMQTCIRAWDFRADGPEV